jgi:hypothetical protein
MQLAQLVAMAGIIITLYALLVRRDNRVLKARKDAAEKRLEALTSR